MATFSTSQEWLHQCSLLLEARPQTTKITTRYSVKPKPARRVKKSAAKDGETLPDAPAKPAAASSATSQNPRAKLVLKAVDPVSGVCLRYETTKAAEVSRLVQLLGQLSRRQAGLAAAAASAAQETEDVVMGEAESAAATSAPSASAAAGAGAGAAHAHASSSQPTAQQQQGGGGGGKGKKKKGKR